MKSKADKADNENQGKAAKAAALQKSSQRSSLRMADNREVSASREGLQMIIDHSPRMTVQRRRIERSFDTPVQRQVLEEEELMQGKLVQRQPEEEEELLQGEFKTIQRQGPEEEEELMQGKFTVQRAELEDEELIQGKFAAQRTENKTGLPVELKTGIENLSGLSLDNVRVHSNSSKPATVGAHAYTQGTDIHVAPGQMKHLPHEAWHVVQQMQGRVQPTEEVAGVPVNDSPKLEKEADVMGGKAV